ncbi:MAG: efflux RND transporter periplasmic adaptor subunit [Alphaproteobacteria bacterium]
MKGSWIRRGLTALVAIVVVVVTVYALIPAPLQVDIATIDRGHVAVTIDEEGIARIRDVFRVSAPIAGKLQRPPVRVGDRVFRGTSEVASIVPLDPPFLDVRSRREIEAAIEASRAAVGLAEAQLRGAEATQRMRQSDMERAERLAAAGTISARALETAATDRDSAAAQVAQAIANLLLRKSELVSAEARLIEPDQQVANPSRDACCLTVRAPVDGLVLSVSAQSEQVVAAGTPLLEIGDPDAMEVIVHLLSSDAVQIVTGAPVRLSDWGGESDLKASVARIDPAAYTKISALGIEEQRVDAVLELEGDPASWAGLGHEFRVMVHITLWENDDAMRVPMGALFRRGTDWNVFRVVDGQAISTVVEIGHRNSTYAEVLAGVVAGDLVVLHPNDKVADEVRVVRREEAAN